MAAREHKYQSVVFWGVDAFDMVREVKQGAQVSVSGDRVVRQAEGRDGQMRVFLVNPPRVTSASTKQPREKVPGVAVEMKGQVAYEPELKAVPGSSGKFYTVITIRPDDGSDKIRAPFFGEDAVELARAVKKGSEVELKGELVEREYTNREGVPDQRTGNSEGEHAGAGQGTKRRAANRHASRGQGEQELGG